MRKEQLERLAEVHDDVLAARIADEVSQACPTYREQLGEGPFAASVRAAVRDARRFDLESDQEVSEFVGLVLVCGERFFERDAYLWAADLLRSGEAGRVRAVSERVEASLRAMAASPPPARG